MMPLCYNSPVRLAHANTCTDTYEQYTRAIDNHITSLKYRFDVKTTPAAKITDPPG